MLAMLNAVMISSATVPFIGFSGFILMPCSVGQSVMHHKVCK